LPGQRDKILFEIFWTIFDPNFNFKTERDGDLQEGRQWVVEHSRAWMDDVEGEREGGLEQQQQVEQMQHVSRQQRIGTTAAC
jgi:hypothetical protein